MDQEWMRLPVSGHIKTGSFVFSLNNIILAKQPSVALVNQHHFNHKNSMLRHECFQSARLAQ